jgi:signal peptidase
MESLQQYVGEFRDLAKRPRNFLTQVLNLSCIVFSALMLWKGLMVVTQSESPVVVVLSGSMEPGFHRGDILFLTMYHEYPFSPGDVVVFQIEGRDIPIVHRTMNVHEKADGTVALLTKGDNNHVDDRGLYAHRQFFIGRKEVMGRAQAFLPYVGMITIWLNDYPWLKYILIGSMGFFVIIGRE